jgi:hypothetical protein
VHLVHLESHGTGNGGGGDKQDAGRSVVFIQRIQLLISRISHLAFLRFYQDGTAALCDVLLLIKKEVTLKRQKTQCLVMIHSIILAQQLRSFLFLVISWCRSA